MKLDSRNLLTLPGNQIVRIAALAINNFLMILCLATLLYQGYSLSNSGRYVINTFSSNSESTQHVARHLKIEDWHLFSVAEKNYPKKFITDSWRLLGTVMGTAPENSYAIIGSSDKSQSVYFIGDRLEDGSILRDISSDEVMVDNNGIINKLHISWNSGPQLKGKNVPDSGSFGRSFSLMKKP